MFDTREYLEGIEPPTFIAPNGKVYVGTVRSYDEWLPFQERLESTLGVDGLSVNNVRQIAYDLTRWLFPKPWWKFWQRSCVYHVMRLPPMVMVKAIFSFIQSQGQALGVEIESTFPGKVPEADLSSGLKPDTSSHDSSGSTGTTSTTVPGGQLEMG